MADDGINKALINAQKLMMTGKLSEAQSTITPILTQDPLHQDALYIQAVLHRYAGDTAQAEQTIKQLLSVQPSFGRALQEMGYILKAKGQSPKAIQAFEQATQANPALTGAWQQLIQLYKATGSGPKAIEATSQFNRLSAMPKELLAVTNFLHEDKLLKAEKLCRAFLKVNPTHSEGMRLLADIASRFGVLDEAEFLLKKAVELAPDLIQLKLDLIQVLRKAQKFDEALQVAKDLLAADGDNPVFQSHFAIQAMQAGDYEAALAGFNQVLGQLPRDAATHTSKGHALKTLGEQDTAVESYRAAIDANPRYGDAWYGLANLKTFKFTAADLDAMTQQVEEALLPVQAQTQMHFALGKGHEDNKNFEQSFHHYAAGNKLRHLESRYDADQMDQEFAAQKAISTPALFNNTERDGCQAPDPIFIVGLPRAGSTLLEQILASHSQVDGTMELPNILMIAQELRGRQKIDAENGYPNCLATLSKEKRAELGERYIQDTRQHRCGAPFFTDKMPNNFRHVALIKLLLPNAKIIDARRDPMACCFSGFKQLFAEGQEFTYDLESLGRYYRGYTDLMDHFDQVMPGAIHRVHYEKMINDSEGEIGKLLDYCGLPFEQACLDFHKTKRAVKTASSEQVREKINTKGLKAWAPFSPYLGPLKEALGDLV